MFTFIQTFLADMIFALKRITSQFTIFAVEVTSRSVSITFIIWWNELSHILELYCHGLHDFCKVVIYRLVIVLSDLSYIWIRCIHIIRHFNLSDIYLPLLPFLQHSCHGSRRMVSSSVCGDFVRTSYKSVWSGIPFDRFSIVIVVKYSGDLIHCHATAHFHTYPFPTRQHICTHTPLPRSYTFLHIALKSL